jgi:hypothetical protein
LMTAGRVGATARFVTWPVVAFSLLASTVALAGLWSGLDRPRLLVAGVPPALAVSYVLPAAPFWIVATALVVLAGAALRIRGVAGGMAMTVGAAMTLFVVIQGPAVECHESGVSSNSGPWWIRAPSVSSGSGTSAPGGVSSGTTQVGGRHYAYSCAGTRLVRFEQHG